MRGGDAVIDELLLEGGQQLEAGLARQPDQRTTQYVAGTESPRHAVDRPDVAQEEIFRCAALERNGHAGGRIGDEKYLADGPKWRHLNGTERRQENVRRGETHAALHACGQIGRRKALTPKVAGKIAGADKDDLLTLHQEPASDFDTRCANISMTAGLVWSLGMKSA
jgi:hypothetical protein